MPTYKTPDVYVEEISVFPPSVAEVETAIPAFIGYTEKAINKTADDLILVPTRIESLKDYELYFGGPKDDAIALTVEDQGDAGYKVTSFTEPTVLYILYYSVKLFFDNGGGQCYITSVGTYQEPAAIELDTAPLDTFGLRDGLDAVALEDEPTLIVIPEAVNLTAADYSSLVEAVLAQCGTLKDRFGIFDLRDGGKDLTSADLDTNRGYFGTSDSLKYGAAYYPFLKTTLNYSVKDDESNVSVIFVPVGGPANAV
ncbi:MAG: phage tail sheath family protein, partial [Chthoniobacterales bacterium]|nr:phage tail sheath family protein [Chthoniobacterales bacterium]